MKLFMKLTNDQIRTIINAVMTLITTITAVLFASCTMALSISRNNTNSTQGVEQSTSVSADSASVKLPNIK